MSSDSSDIEIRTVIKNNTMKRQIPEDLIVKEEKKLTTKDMIYQALEQSKSRKGTSVQAIKKYIAGNFRVDTDKINYLINKTLKAGVETGTYVQTKGIGASGSFKLAPKTKEVKIEPAKAKTTKEKVEGKSEVKKEKSIQKVVDSDNKKKKSKKVMIDEPPKKIKKKTKYKDSEPKPGTSKMIPIKRKKIMKRKSIGSIIKPPKMKPKVNG